MATHLYDAELILELYFWNRWMSIDNAEVWKNHWICKLSSLITIASKIKPLALQTELTNYYSTQDWMNHWVCKLSSLTAIVPGARLKYGLQGLQPMNLTQLGKGGGNSWRRNLSSGLCPVWYHWSPASIGRPWSRIPIFQGPTDSV